MAGRVGKLASSTDLEYETRMRLAIDGLAEGTYRTISAASKAQKVARQTLSDREGAVNEWLVLNSSTATPLHPRDLRARAFEISQGRSGTAATHDATSRQSSYPSPDGLIQSVPKASTKRR
ncbi:hypothetical protein EDD15DRAFT_2365083 [Pisolithus albus]|nr:hypothetical protein EDD15DRAFT_2533965 [Pisolithus albus]KAI5996251.1 hypothetical protein EDD15DRAFT_2365083 [Pisolithus albus]